MTAGRIGLGIACGLGAGALWGLVFLAPELGGDFSPLALAAGRYLAYGVLALILVAPRRRVLWASLGWAEWRALLWLSLLGNILYFVLLARAVQTGGVAMTSLVIGFLPVLVTLIGSRERGAVALWRLAPSLLLGLAGIGCIGVRALVSGPGGGAGAHGTGLLCAVGALLSWTVYAVLNSRWLARLGRISAHEWSLLTGVVTGAEALLLAVVAGLSGMGRHDAAAWGRFAVLSAGTAVAASIIGNGLWNRASRLLPLTLVGQMILFETLFALLYGFLWEQRLPNPVEMLAIGLVIGSVLSCVAAHGKKG